MKKVLLAAALATGISGVASAKDIRSANALFTPAPAATWTGFYVGVNGGGNWGSSDTSLDVTTSGGFFEFPFCLPPNNFCQVNVVDVRRAGAQHLDTSGFIAGLQAGYNWQSGSFVFGVETDINYFRSQANGAGAVPLVSGLSGYVAVTQSVSTDWLWTLRGRLGFEVSPGWLIYATGGLAVTNFETAWTFRETRFNNAAGAAFHDIRTGWVIGGGVDTRIPGGWIAGLEYLFVDFGTQTSTVPILLPPGSSTLTPQNFTQSADLQTHIVRLRLNKPL